jgi:hypothetical protein
VPVALGPCWSADCSREAASRIGCALGWDSMRIGQELESFEEERRLFLHPQPKAASARGCDGVHQPPINTEIA